jgi:hypothetical protein
VRRILRIEEPGCSHANAGDQRVIFKYCKQSSGISSDVGLPRCGYVLRTPAPGPLRGKLADATGYLLSSSCLRRPAHLVLPRPWFVPLACASPRGLTGNPQTMTDRNSLTVYGNAFQLTPCDSPHLCKTVLPTLILQNRNSRYRANIAPYPGRQAQGRRENSQELRDRAPQLSGAVPGIRLRQSESHSSYACVAAVVAPAVANDGKMGSLAYYRWNAVASCSATRAAFRAALRCLTSLSTVISSSPKSLTHLTMPPPTN